METSIGRNEATFPTPGIFFEGDKGEEERERERSGESRSTASALRDLIHFDRADRANRAV